MGGHVDQECKLATMCKNTFGGSGCVLIHTFSGIELPRDSVQPLEDVQPRIPSGCFGTQKCWVNESVNPSERITFCQTSRNTVFFQEMSNLWLVFR